MTLETIEHLMAEWGFPTTILIIVGVFLWVWGFNRSDNEKRRGYFTKLADRRLVNEERIGKFMEVAASTMEADQAWKQQQVDQCRAHVTEIAAMGEHQREHNVKADVMIGELKSLNKGLFDSDGITAPTKRIEVTMTEMLDLALLIYDKPMSELTDQEKQALRDKIVKARDRHARNGT